MKIKLTLITLLFLFSVEYTKAQGCSDAGICTAGALHSEADGETYKNSIQLYAIYGIGDGATSIFTPQVDVNIGIANKGSLQLRLPYVFTSGNLGSTNGLGDIIANYTHKLYTKDSFELRGTIGGRFATNTANLANDTGRALPMPYQTSLGTNDLLLGISATYKKWNFAVGFQLPLSQNNQNGFIPSGLNSNDSDYFTSNKLNRSADIVLRAERKFSYKKFQWAIGVLPIYHIANDKVINPFIERIVEVPNSAGLTFNFVMSGKYPLRDNLSLNASLGFPLLVRENRPDGLTRAFVLSPSIQWFF